MDWVAKKVTASAVKNDTVHQRGQWADLRAHHQRSRIGQVG